MKLIDRYVSEVGKRLVLVRGRQDIEKELRSTLEDMLEDRAEKAGRPADEALELDLLREYGTPDKVAQTYNPHPYLVGPRLFPVFLLLVKIVLAAIALGFVIATAMQIITQPPATYPELLKLIGQGLLNMFSGFIAGFGNLALIFAALERFTPASELEFGDLHKVGGKLTVLHTDGDEWDPRSLLKEPEPQDVRLWEPILAIVFTLFVIGIFNFNRQWLSLYYDTRGVWSFGFNYFIADKAGSIPLFSDAFFRWLPLMNIAWLAEIVLNGMLLRTARWNITTRLISIGTKIVQIIINLLLLSGPFILGITAQGLVASKLMDETTAQVVVNGMRTAMPILLGLGILGKVVEIGQTGYKMLKQDKR